MIYCIDVDGYIGDAQVPSFEFNNLKKEPW